MDIQLPMLDGYNATRQIKALPGFTVIPIIAVSSFAMKGDEEKARAAGCDDDVTTPYSPVRLLVHHTQLSRREVMRIIGQPTSDARRGHDNAQPPLGEKRS
jgi:CheY-like chemotaxis protein